MLNLYNVKYFASHRTSNKSNSFPARSDLLFAEEKKLFKDLQHNVFAFHRITNKSIIL